MDSPTLRSQITGFLDLEAPDHDFFDLRAPNHRSPRSGDPRAWISLIWKPQTMDFLDLGDLRSWITLIWKSQIMDFLDQVVPVDLEAPDHGFP